MDFINILSQLSQLSEATKKTDKGIEHKAEPGGYGRKYDTDEEGDEKKKDKKAKKDEPKKGRGRPKKDSDEKGEVKKYDTKSLHDVFGGGKKPKKDIGKTSKKHSLKEWVEEIEQKYVAEAIPPGMKPLAILDPKNQQAGAGVLTSTNPAVQKMLGSIDPKDVKIVQTTQGTQIKPAGQQPTATAGGATQQPAMAEEGEKWIQKAIKHPGALRKKLHAKPGEPIPAGKLEKATHSKDPKTARQARLAQTLRGLKEGDIPSDQMDMGAGLGAGRKDNTFEGAKPDFLDLDKDGNKKESMKKAAADKKKKKVDEGMDTRLKAAHHSGKAHALSKQGYNCNYDDMEEARMYHEGYKEGLDECYGQVPIRGGVVDEMGMPPATVGGMADQAEGLDEMDMYEMDKTEWMKHKAKTTPGNTFKAFGQTMHDKDVLETSMFESWDNELNSLLEEYDTIQEGLSVNISKGQQGAPDSVSVTANDAEADQLLQLVKAAGLGLFGDNTPSTSSPMSLQPADDGDEHGEGDIDVVGDHDGMMALIKKVTGGAGEPNTVAIGTDDHDHDHEGHDHDYKDEEDTDESKCNECGMYESDCECDHGQEQVDEVESEDQMAYQVAEESDKDEDDEHDHDDDKCPDCGKDPCECDDEEEDDEGEEEEVDESLQLDEWANEAGQKGTDAAFEADIQFMTKVIAGGLNKEKATGQTTIPVIAGQNDRMGYEVNESLTDWKKLAGLK